MVTTFEIEAETGSLLTNNGRATGDEKTRYLA
jgi:hypothetical protein